MADQSAIGERVDDVRRQIRVDLEIDRQRLGSESAFGIVDGQKPQDGPPRISRPWMGKTLIPPADQITG